jgi:hypothetical protein
MPSDESIRYEGVAANGNSRLHAGHVYSNVVNSKRTAYRNVRSGLGQY